MLAVGASQMWADYTITFKTGTNGNSAATSSTAVSDCVESTSLKFISSLTPTNSVYYGATNGVQFGKASGNGSLIINLSNEGQVSAKEIIFHTTPYNNDKDKAAESFKATINGSQEDALIKTGKPADSPLSLKFTTPVDLKSIKIETTSSKNGRFCVSKIEVIEAAKGPVDPTWAAKDVLPSVTAFQAIDPKDFLNIPDAEKGLKFNFILTHMDTREDVNVNTDGTYTLPHGGKYELDVTSDAVADKFNAGIKKTIAFTAAASKDVPLSWSAESYSIYADETDFSGLPKLNNEKNLPVTYSSLDEEVATISADGATINLLKAGDTLIIAEFAGNDDYVKKEVSYSLTVVDPNFVEAPTFEGGIKDDKGDVNLYVGDALTFTSTEGTTMEYTLIYDMDESNTITGTSTDNKLVLTFEQAHDLYQLSVKAVKGENKSEAVEVFGEVNKHTATIAYNETYSKLVGEEFAEEPLFECSCGKSLAEHTNISYLSNHESVKVDANGKHTLAGATGETPATVTVKMAETNDHNATETSYKVAVTKHQLTLSLGEDKTLDPEDGTTYTVAATAEGEIEGHVPAIVYTYEVISGEDPIASYADGKLVLNEKYGEVTLTAALSADEAFYTADATTCKLTVKAKELVSNFKFDWPQGEQVLYPGFTESDGTEIPAFHTTANQTKPSGVADSFVHIKVTTTSKNNSCQYMNSSKNQHLGVYSGATMHITPLAGYAIKSIVYSFASEGWNSWADENGVICTSTLETSNWTKDSDKVFTYTPDNPSKTTMDFNASGTVRINSIVITYVRTLDLAIADQQINWGDNMLSGSFANETALNNKAFAVTVVPAEGEETEISDEALKTWYLNHLTEGTEVADSRDGMIAYAKNYLSEHADADAWYGAKDANDDDNSRCERGDASKSTCHLHCYWGGDRLGCQRKDDRSRGTEQFGYHHYGDYASNASCHLRNYYWDYLALNG